MKQKQRRAKVPQQRGAPAEAVRRAPASAITFKVNTIFFDEAQSKLVHLEAGRPSPFRFVEDIPVKLQGLIGLPPSGDSTPPDSELQHWTPKPLVDLEDEEFEKLARGQHEDPEIQAKLDERNEEHLESTKARNQALTEVADRADEAIDRIAEELEAENEELDDTHTRIGRMV